MTKWLMEWLTLSIIGVFGIGALMVLSTVWSLIPERISESGLGALDTEGKFALLLLFVIGVGCVKLFSKSE
ncbi:MAG: hypothetical protein P1S60_19110 [Anaerolineae bacterium]|nr:hypothetical protein [Anaerolineae bacterium]